MSIFGSQIPSITVRELADRQAEPDAPFVLDVRQPHEREFASIGGLHIEMSTLPDRLGEIEEHKDKEIVVYCRSGQRSANVVRFLQSNGFPKALNLEGGILAWSREIDPAIKQY
ncbi:MAG: rhodanese-related sulfurtransferase [Rhodothermales bacterium]